MAIARLQRYPSCSVSARQVDSRAGIASSSGRARRFVRASRASDPSNVGGLTADMSRRTDLRFACQNSFGSHVLPNGLVGEGKSTNARLQSSTFDGSASFAAAPLTTTRLSVDEKIGRFTM